MGQKLANANQKVLLNLGTDVEVNHKLVEERCSRSVQNMAYIQETAGLARKQEEELGWMDKEEFWGDKRDWIMPFKEVDLLLKETG